MTYEGITVPKVTVARFAAPRVTITPVTDVISSEPIPGRSKPGHYQQVLLDTRTAELRFHESTEHLEPRDPAWTSTSDVPRDTWRRWHPGKLFAFNGPHQWFEPVPELLCWVIDSGTPGWPYLDAAAANALLEEVLPVTQELLDGLFDGGGDLDWSCRSARAGRNMNRLLSRDRKAAESEADAELVDFAEIADRFPQVYQPAYLRYPLEALAEACESVTRYIGSNEHWHQEIKKVFGTPYSDGSGIGLQVLGVRCWYRTVLMQGDPRPLREFADWDTEHARLAAGEITSTTTDAELARWADLEEEEAARLGWRLLGAQDAAISHRQRLREQEWDRLAVVSADIAVLEDEPALSADALEPKQAERLTLITSAISYGRSDGEIAVRARMPRRTVLTLRETGTTAGNKQK